MRAMSLVDAMGTSASSSCSQCWQRWLVLPRLLTMWSWARSSPPCRSRGATWCVGCSKPIGDGRN